MKPCKLVCVDVDNTLVTRDLRLPEENRVWVQRLVKEKHIPFAIVSGRFRGSVTPLVRELGVDTIVCCFNGNYVEMNGEVLFQRQMDVDVVRDIHHATRDSGMYGLIFDLDDWYVESKGYWYDHQLKMSPDSGHIVNFDQLLDKWEREGHPFFKIILKSQDAELVKRTETLLRERMGSGADVFLSSPNILETAPKGTDKASVVALLAEKLHISVDEIMAIGDYDNDLGMLRASGFPVAVENATDEVKAVSKYVTSSCGEAGVAKAIRKFIFG